MRVIFLSSRNDMSGARKLFTMLSTELSLQHDVTILYPIFPDFTLMRNLRKRPSLRGYIKKCLIDCRNVLESPRWKYASLLNGRVKVRAYWAPYFPKRCLERADVVIYGSAYQALELDRIRPAIRHSVYYVLHDQSLSDGHFVDPAIIRETYRNRDRKVALSEDTAGRLRNWGVCVDTVVPSGIDPSIFNESGRMASDQIRILVYYWPGEPRKGASQVLEILRSARKNHPELRVSLLTPPRVSVKGFHSCSALSEHEMADVYRGHDIFIFPSTYEGFGLPPLEAMACGCAVIAAKVGAVLEYARHGHSAWLCEPGKSEQIEEALDTLIKDHALVARLGANAAIESSRWTWRHAGTKMNAYLASLGAQPVTVTDGASNECRRPDASSFLA